MIGVSKNRNDFQFSYNNKNTNDKIVYHVSYDPNNQKIKILEKYINNDKAFYILNEEEARSEIESKIHNELVFMLGDINKNAILKQNII